MIVKVFINEKTIKELIFHPCFPNCILQVQLLSFKENRIGKGVKIPSCPALDFPMVYRWQLTISSSQYFYNLCPMAICMSFKCHHLIKLAACYLPTVVGTGCTYSIHELCSDCFCTYSISQRKI